MANDVAIALCRDDAALQGPVRHEIPLVLVALASFERVDVAAGPDPRSDRKHHPSLFEELAACRRLKALAGLEPMAYRATDLAIHVVNGWLVFAVARRLQPRLSAWAACLAAAVFFLHPGGEEIVAWIERRSYSIATCLSLLGLWAALGAVRSPHARGFGARVAGAALAFGLSLVSNEMAVLAIAALPALVFVCAPAEPGRLRASLRVVAPILGAVALSFAFRTWVVGEVGGYTPKEMERMCERPFMRHILATGEVLYEIDPA